MDDCHHSSLQVHDASLVLVLKSRKNRPQGSRLTRTCWCSTCPEVCPVHRLGNFSSSLPMGSKPFAGISPGQAISDLRALLTRLSVKDAPLYRTHDLRRGHARHVACLHVKGSASKWGYAVRDPEGRRMAQRWLHGLHGPGRARGRCCVGGPFSGL